MKLFKAAFIFLAFFILNSCSEEKPVLENDIYLNEKLEAIYLKELRQLKDLRNSCQERFEDNTTSASISHFYSNIFDELNQVNSHKIKLIEAIEEFKKDLCDLNGEENIIIKKEENHFEFQKKYIFNISEIKNNEYSSEIDNFLFSERNCNKIEIETKKYVRQVLLIDSKYKIDDFPNYQYNRRKKFVIDYNKNNLFLNKNYEKLLKNNNLSSILNLLTSFEIQIENTTNYFLDKRLYRSSDYDF